MNISYLSPSGQVPQQLADIFGCYPWKAIEKTSELNATWRTLKGYPIRPRTLVAKYFDPALQIGVRFGSKTFYGLLDIDSGSEHLNPASIRRLQNCLETIGITDTLIVRSSDSGGIHLYYSLPDAVKTFDLACTIKHALKSHGFDLSAGRLESFPNVKSYARADLNQFSEYHGHRLPLQPGSGSCLLDADLNPRGDSLERLLWEWEQIAARQDMALLLEALPIGRAANWPKRQRKVKKPDLWREDLERDIKAGFTGPGQTNAFIKAVGCYCRVFLGLGGDALREHMEPMVILAPGFEEFCRHQDEIEIRIASWARSIDGYYWPLGTEPQRTIDHLSINFERAREARARISAAVRRLTASGDLAAGIRARRDQLITAAATSAQTLQKYISLWHPLGWCVPPLISVIPADAPASDRTEANRLKPVQRGLVHTFRRIMKCVSLESHPIPIYLPLERGLQGGDSGQT